MRAVVIRQAGGPEVLVIEDRPAPVLGRSEILVRVRASALNRADLLQRRGFYPAPAGVVQDIPGLEYAGEVAALGDDASLWRTGDRVMGIVGGGGHAEFVRVHEREAIAIPDSLSFEDAAAVPEAFMTAYDALVRQGDMGSGDRVLIHAVASGVGTAALQIARTTGAVVAGTARSAEKLAPLHDLGLHTGIISTDAKWVEELEKSPDFAGFEVILDLVGAAVTEGSLRLLAPRGRLLILGTLSGASANIDLRILMSKRARIIGSVLRSRPIEEKVDLARDFSHAILPQLARGVVRPVVDRIYPFPEIVQAHHRMESNFGSGKIVLVW